VASRNSAYIPANVQDDSAGGRNPKARYRGRSGPAAGPHYPAIKKKQPGRHCFLEKEFPVWMSDIYDLRECATDDIGLFMALRSGDSGKKLANRIRHDIHQVYHVILRAARSICDLEGPLMFAGRQTFVDTLLGYAG